MRIGHLAAHLELQGMDQREMLRLAGKAGLAGAVAQAGLVGFTSGSAGADEPAAEGRTPGSDEDFDDVMFDVEAVQAGAWDATAFYSQGDQRGTFEEVTPEKTAESLRILNRGREVVTYNLGELMFNGFPAFATTPDDPATTNTDRLITRAHLMSTSDQTVQRAT